MSASSISVETIGHEREPLVAHYDAFARERLAFFQAEWRVSA